MQQETCGSDHLPQTNLESPEAQGFQGDQTFETDSSILNCTILNTGQNIGAGIELGEESYENYLLALMQCEEAGMNALNWVVGTPAPIHRPISPAQNTAHHRQRVTVYATPVSSGVQKSSPKCGSDAYLNPGAEINPVNDPTCSGYRKPTCSYTCLIGMALQASKNGCLPVNEIYKFIECEYPFFRTAPEGWKNSVRHSLSLNQCFRKVERTDGWQGKKGYFWEINPARRGAVEREIEKWLKEEGRFSRDPRGLYAPLDVPFSTAFPASLQARVPVMPTFLQSSCVPRRPSNSVSSALGLSEHMQTPQQVAQLQHLAQQLQQECAERMAQLRSPGGGGAPSQQGHSLPDPGEGSGRCSQSAEGASPASADAGESSLVLLNVDEPPSRYISSLERSSGNFEDLSDGLFGGFDVSFSLEDADNSFQSYILSDDVTFRSDVEHVITMSPAVEVEVPTVSSGGDSSSSSAPSSNMASTNVSLQLAADPEVSSSSHVTSTPIHYDAKQEVQSSPCCSKTLKKGRVHRPCACQRLFAGTGQGGVGYNKKGGPAANLCVPVQLKTSLRKHVTPKRLHPPHHHHLRGWEFPGHKEREGVIAGELAATGDDLLPWKVPECPMTISISLHKLETEGNMQQMDVDNEPNGGDPKGRGHLNPMNMSDVFQEHSDQVYWNDSDIASPTFNGLTEEELKELQKDLFSGDLSVVLNKEDSTGEGQDEVILLQNHLSKGLSEMNYALMVPSCSKTCEAEAERIAEMASELQREVAMYSQTEQPTSHSLEELPAISEQLASPGSHDKIQ